MRLRNIIFCTLVAPALLFCEANSPQKLKTLYNSLDPESVSQHLYFYQLYPDTPLGQKSLGHAWNLMSKGIKQSGAKAAGDIPGITSIVPAIVALVNKQPYEDIPELSDEELEGIEELAYLLPNRKLKGHFASNEKEVLELPFQEIDLARGLFLSQLGEEAIRKIRSYEAMLDLMALQILARAPIDAPPKAKIRAMNDFIFFEMGFRFPPHSLYAKDIDLYTFLPSVLDSRRGVCLGVSILYMSLAQRLGLNLEMVTPPGHIYVRYSNGDEVINIETTARGIHLKSEDYLGIETRSLQMRNIKEVIGLAHFNQASVFWQNGEHAKAIASYLKANPYIPQDSLLTEFLGYVYLFDGQKEEGGKLLEKVKDYLPDYAIVKHTIAEDYLNGNVDEEGIRAIFEHVDETRQSIIEKQKHILETLTRYPLFRSGWFHLAVTWLQLHRNKEALEVLEYYHRLDGNDPDAEYYLAMLYAERLHYSKAWHHLRQAEQIVHARQHNPKALQNLRKELAMSSTQPY